jgi:hypothetical protein
MADLKRKQLRQFLSGSFNITGSLNVTGSVEFDKNVSGSITSTGSFSRLQSDTISVTHSPFASGSEVQTIMDATGSYASASTTYLMESQTGSFATGSDVQGILDTYVRQSETSSFASGSDVNQILIESSSYVVESETGSFASGSDFHQILTESSSYVVESETGSFASGSDFHSILAESSSYVMSTNTGSFLQNTDTASFSTLHVEGNITTSGSVTAQQFYTEVVSSSIIYESGSTQFGDTLDDTHKITGSFEITGSLLSIDSVGGVSSSLTSTSSFGKVELADTDHITPFASGSDLHSILAESSSYVMSTSTGSYASGSDLHQILAESSSYIVESETGSFASGSDFHQILTESSSYVVESETGSFASGSDLHQFLVESASYLVADTSMSFVDVSGSITSTGSFGKLRTEQDTFVIGNLTVGADVIGQKLQVDGDTGITGQLDVTGSVSGGLSSTGSFGYVEQLGVKLVDSNQTASFASGSDFHQILTESSSYLVNSDTGSLGLTTFSSNVIVLGDLSTSGSITAREFKTEFVSSSIIYASGSNQFGDTGDDVHEFSGSLKIGNLTFSTSSIGIQSDTDLISLSDDTFTLNGSIVINDGANIGIDSDTDLLDLNDQNLIINGKLDSTGRIDAQNGLQVSGSTLAVGNDLTLDYTSPVSHSLVYINHSNKTLDLVPPASASGQIVIFDGTDWVISDEIDGGSF